MKIKVRQTLALIFLILLVSPRPAAGQSGEVEVGQDLSAATVERILEVAIRDDDDKVRVIVELADASLATYSGGVSGLRATSPAATGASKLAITEAANVAYLDHLTRQQEAFVQDLAQQVPSATVDYRYQIVFNGLAMAVHPDEVAHLLKLPGVKNIYPDHLFYGSLDGSLDVIQAPAMWAELGGRSQAGEGIFVAVIDSGVAPKNPMFFGAGFQMPSGFPKGFCATQPENPYFQCNNKLVAARYYNPPSGYHPKEVALPLDINGHGSHVAGIAVGNPLIFKAGRSESPDNSISGVAPGAYLMVYKALFHMADPEHPDEVGAGSSLIAALEDAVADGADVINNSWGSIFPPNHPAEQLYEELITNITEAGVLVVFGAGNDGPDPGTINCPGCVKDALTVANSSTDRLDLETLEVIGPRPVPARLRSLGVQPGTGPALPTALTGPLKYAGTVDPANSEGCQPFPVNAFHQSLAIIRRGTCPYLTKVTHATQAGASVVVVLDSSTRPPIIMTELEETTIPAVMMSQNDGQALVDWLMAHPTAPGQINGMISRRKPRLGRFYGP
jgi:minor extracellular serine protease Vpr